MLRTFRSAALASLAVLFLLEVAFAHPAAPLQSDSTAKSQRLPRPQPLGHGVILERDRVSRELHPSKKDASSPSREGTIRSRVTLVQVPCTVATPDGAQVRGLTQDNFRLFEDDALQDIASFDASVTPASIALIIDASPSIYRDLAEMRGAARALAENLSPADEIAVVSFSAEAHLLMPFSTNRSLLDRAIDSKYLAQVENSSESKIYQSVFFTARELFQGRTGRKAIVLLTDGQDSGLGLTWDASSAEPRPGEEASRLAFDDVAR